MSSAEIWGTIVGIVSVAGLLLEYLTRRSPSQQIAEHLAKHDDEIAALQNTINHWKNSP